MQGANESIVNIYLTQQKHNKNQMSLIEPHAFMIRHATGLFDLNDVDCMQIIDTVLSFYDEDDCDSFFDLCRICNNETEFGDALIAALKTTKNQFVEASVRSSASQCYQTASKIEKIK